MIKNKYYLAKILTKISNQILKGDQVNPKEFTAFSATLVLLVLQGSVIDKRFARKIADAFQNHQFLLTKDEETLLHLECCIQIIKEYIECSAFSKTSLDNYFKSLTTLLDLEESSQLNLSRKNYPSRIHVETLSLCNAKCSFCDYAQLQRKGEKMSITVIEKILDDLSEIPDSHSFVITPYKVSEPFLDKRLGLITDKFLSFHKGSSVEIISNGNYMPEETIRQLQHISNSSPKCLSNKHALSFAISLNETSKTEYESLMKLSHKRTLQNLDKLHKLYSEELRNVSIRLTRVSTSAKSDADFRDFCSKNFPKFQCSLLKLNDWASSNQYSNDILNSRVSYRNLYAKSPCHRWTDLSIMANGDLALCCMDSGINLQKLGNVKNENCLKLYFEKNSRFIPDSLQRKDAPLPCKNCTYFQTTSHTKDLFKNALQLAINSAII